MSLQDTYNMCPPSYICNTSTQNFSSDKPKTGGMPLPTWGGIHSPGSSFQQEDHGHDFQEVILTWGQSKEEVPISSQHVAFFSSAFVVSVVWGCSNFLASSAAVTSLCLLLVFRGRAIERK